MDVEERWHGGKFKCNSDMQFFKFLIFSDMLYGRVRDGSECQLILDRFWLATGELGANAP